MDIKKLWSLTINGKEEHGKAFEGGHVNTERLSNSSSVDEINERRVANHEVREEELKQEARQIRSHAEAQASQIIADAQTTAQDQVDAMVRGLWGLEAITETTRPHNPLTRHRLVRYNLQSR